MPLSKEEQKQYSRHLILETIGEKGQLQLKAAKVLVIGSGGLSCPVLQYLTAAGVGTIGIIDNDRVDQTNLQRQILYTIEDVGKHKALCAAHRLSLLNPFVNFQTYTERLSQNNAIDLFEAYDIIVDGTDNFQTKYLVNDAAVLTNKPVVFGSIFKFDGQVSVMNYKSSATYRCLYPTPPKPDAVPNCSDIGVLGVLPGIIGCLQANEVIKIICNLGNILANKLLTFNALSLKQFILEYEKNETISITKLEEDYDFFCGVAPQKNEIIYEELQAHLNRYNLLDVRTIAEREEKHIGGKHIPLNELQERLSEIETDKDLVVYCLSGGRSKQAINLIKNANINVKLINLKQGLMGI
ncbi:ThiF family adenylyltransferase [Tamlana fucoidanivorans]|uniref:Molybdopterin-synthase adenylyltransferase n=1 Tax=Allotamlana fucoidanivorans TaxID=2583814 RepID=A0A5C4SRP6_9FLAO|nr:ThiF family adenylyltransferase [Tamlana fucoidanivorans]TNJ47090.1 dinucleotide-utilizing protein [Tamlana fucoidanivorans]